GGVQDIPTTSDRGHPCCGFWGIFQCRWHSAPHPASARDLAPRMAQTASQATRPSRVTQKERTSVKCRGDLYIEEVSDMRIDKRWFVAMVILFLPLLVVGNAYGESRHRWDIPHLSLSNA